MLGSDSLIICTYDVSFSVRTFCGVFTVAIFSCMLLKANLPRYIIILHHQIPASLVCLNSMPLGQGFSCQINSCFRIVYVTKSMVLVSNELISAQIYYLSQYILWSLINMHGNAKHNKSLFSSIIHFVFNYEVVNVLSVSNVKVYQINTSHFVFLLIHLYQWWEGLPRPPSLSNTILPCIWEFGIRTGGLIRTYRSLKPL